MLYSAVCLTVQLQVATPEPEEFLLHLGDSVLAKHRLVGWWEIQLQEVCCELVF